MNKTFIEQQDPSDDRVHILYDLDIEDVRIRQERAKRCDNAVEAAQYLGVTPQKIFANRIGGLRLYSGKLNKTFAIRTERKGKEQDQR